MPVRNLLPTPKLGSLPFLEESTPLIEETSTSLPNLEDFGFLRSEIENSKDARASLDFIGGEEAALNRLQDYMYGSNSLWTYKKTRNGLMGANFSSKLSPWMANGTISPRYIYH